MSTSFLQRMLSAVVPSGAIALALGIGLARVVPPAAAETHVAVSPQELAVVQSLSDVFKDVGKIVEPSVVNIHVTKTVKSMGRMPAEENFLRRFFDDESGMRLPRELFENQPRAYKEIGTGSGTIMEASNGVGYILTNNHVVGGAGEMVITLSDGRQITDAKVLGTDPKTDLAVVEVKADHLTPAHWGDSATLQQGDWVMAFGSPFGYVGSMTHGIVSGLNRQAGILGSEGYENFIQVDAPINPGNSGGPLVNVKGEVVGINTAIASRDGAFQGIGFAIPADQARPIYQTLRDKGEVVRGWLGLEIESVAGVTAEAKATGYTGDAGILVKAVLKDSPASGNLQPGDVIIALNGKAIADAHALRNQIAMMAPGTEVTLRISRSGKEQTVTVKLGQLPANLTMKNGGNADEQPLGMQLADLTGDLAQKFGLSAKSGAIVVAVRPNSPAAEAGIRPGDLITQVGDQPVAGTAQAEQDLSKADLSKGVRLYITNREGSEFVFVQASHG